VTALCPGVDAHRVPECEQHRGSAARVPGVHVVDRREGGGRRIGRLRQGPGHQCAGRAVQGAGVGECVVAAGGETLGLRHRDEARVVKRVIAAEGYLWARRYSSTVKLSGV